MEGLGDGLEFGNGGCLEAFQRVLSSNLVGLLALMKVLLSVGAFEF